ncbi:hypothetical protein BA915_02210 [Helicobacter pullorum]|nr:hypothetical protein HPU229254_04825 [Helicobacter pullorum]OCR16931.1 hypothetical protein BA915_02210 [Helicobacter pullorum]
MQKFISKAQNLKKLQGKLKSAKILPMVITSLKQFEEKQEILRDILCFETSKVIVRSSSKSEDSKENSNAGAFLSIANVPKQEKEIVGALQRVAQSMPNLDDEILIQPMLENVLICGVAMSVNKDTLAPYYCIEYDESGKTDSITDGSAKEKINFFCHREAPLPNNSQLKSIIMLLKELENIFDYPFLDVEFAIDKQGEIYCLQVRPLVIQNKINLNQSLPLEALKRLQKRFLSLQKTTADVYGKRTIFGVMPDWNPAEIIGLKPKRLALSLYKEIITDSIWAYQRDNYGYLNLRSHPLMHSFLGIPYIDVRLSFNSFIPKNLDTKIAAKLVEFYLDSLSNNPHLHDKVEFDIVFSCYDLNTPKKLQKLQKFNFNANEIKRIEFALLELTNNIIDPQKGLYLKDIEKIKKLRGIHKKIEEADLSIIDKIYWAIESCKRYGTLPFAGIARAGFVAMQMLNSLVEIGFFSREEREEFLNSLKTISKTLSCEVARLNLENKEEFLEQFGHLRAGTYNILSPRYDEAFEEYFDIKTNSNIAYKEESRQPFELDSSKMKILEDLLVEHGLKIEAKEFLGFLKCAIEGREYAKFEFTRLLSYVLVLIGKLGDYYGISKEDMAHLDIKSILSLYASLYSKNPKERFLDEIKYHKEEYQLTLALKLPILITDSSEIFSFFETRIVPNFVTQKEVNAQVALHNDREVEGKIVLIKSADPGFDYLFAKNIAGLITCYGGANSHMAIRASELGLPAAIGVGEDSFERYLQAKRIRLDCQSEQIICL